MAVSYVIGVYGVLQRLGVLTAGLYHQAQDTDDPLSILVPHFPEGHHRGLETHLMSLHRELVEVCEGMRRYPIVYYYHSRRAYRSLPFAFRMIGGMASALRWGLPKNHPGRQTSWLPTLISYLDELFLSEEIEDPPEPVPFETFEAALEREKESLDPWLGRFLQIQSFMREIARLEDTPDPEEAYEHATSGATLRPPQPLLLRGVVQRPRLRARRARARTGREAFLGVSISARYALRASLLSTRPGNPQMACQLVSKAVRFVAPRHPAQLLPSSSLA